MGDARSTQACSNDNQPRPRGPRITASKIFSAEREVGADYRLLHEQRVFRGRVTRARRGQMKGNATTDCRPIDKTFHRTAHPLRAGRVNQLFNENMNQIISTEITIEPLSDHAPFAKDIFMPYSFNGEDEMFSPGSFPKHARIFFGTTRTDNKFMLLTTNSKRSVSKFFWIFAFAITLLAGTKSFAAENLTPADEAIAPYANETPAERDARLAWWRDARFGLFIH